MIYYIYGLRDKGKKLYRYIGKTSDPRQRMHTHRSPNKRKRQGNLSKWVSGVNVVMDILHEVDCSDNEATLLEYETILLCRKMGCDLINTNRFQGGSKVGRKNRKWKRPTIDNPQSHLSAYFDSIGD